MPKCSPSEIDLPAGRRPSVAQPDQAPRRLRRLICLAIAAGMLPVALTPLAAETIEVPAKIDQVTVYPDGALVRRAFSVDLPAGSHEIVIANLPPSIDQASLRVDGTAEGRVLIGAVDFRLSAAVPPPANANAAKLKTLRAELDVLNDRIDALEGKRTMIRRLANSGGEGKDSRPLEMADWTKAWDAVGGALAQVNAELRAQRLEVARIEEEIRAIAASDQPQRPLPPRRIAVISVDAASAGKASLALSYRVSGAAWRPVYDVRLALAGAKPSLDLVQRAMIRQNTGEDWPEANLTLSTLRVAGGTATPDLYGERLAFYERPVPMPRAIQSAPAPAVVGRAPAEALRQDEERQRLAAAAPPPPIEEVQASLESGAFQSEFQLPERFSLPSGNQEKSVRLATLASEATISHRTAPALDAKAYLEASFEVKGETPLLAGEVLLTRDGSFIGKGRIGQTAPGEMIRLGFGADDRVLVKRVPVGRRARDPGVLGSTRSEDLRFRIEVRNLQAFPVELTVLDRVPVSEDREITVERLPDMTKPDSESVEDRRGVFSWKATLKPAETRSYVTAYRLRWPAGREVRLQPLPR